MNNGLSHGGGDIYRKFVIEEDSLKWKDRHPEYEFAMTIADTDLNIDAGIKQAIVNRLNKVNNFTYKTISEEYSASVINWLKQRHCRSPGLDIQVSNIIGSPSLATLIYVAIHALTQ